jgi:hypothetical protein
MEPYSSPDAPVPALRGDLDIQLIRDNGEEMLLLRDAAGYSDEMLVFRPQAWALLSMFDGVRSVHGLQQEIFEATKTHVDEEQLVGIVRALDTYLFLDNERFAEAKARADEEYRNAALRPAVHAGASYPEDAEELRAFFDTLFKGQDTVSGEGRLLGIIAPHIDLQIGPQVYVPAFRQLAQADIDTMVILGTSHYSYEDLFILTSKNFVTPLGALPTDREFVTMLHSEERRHIHDRRTWHIGRNSDRISRRVPAACVRQRRVRASCRYSARPSRNFSSRARAHGGRKVCGVHRAFQAAVKTLGP